MVDFPVVQNKLEALLIRKGARDTLRKQLDDARQGQAEHEALLEAAQRARAILQEAAQATQQQLEFHVADIVTTALQAVFPEPYEFVVRFEIKRGKTECVMLFKRDGEEFDPMESCGGGPIDVAAFALRVAFWSLSRRNGTRPLIILDEPFKFVSRKGDLQTRCSEMVKTLSDKLGIQILMVSHLPDIIACADKIIPIHGGKVVAE